MRFGEEAIEKIREVAEESREKSIEVVEDDCKHKEKYCRSCQE